MQIECLCKAVEAAGLQQMCKCALGLACTHCNCTSAQNKRRWYLSSNLGDELSTGFTLHTFQLYKTKHQVYSAQCVEDDGLKPKYSAEVSAHFMAVTSCLNEQEQKLSQWLLDDVDRTAVSLT